MIDAKAGRARGSTALHLVGGLQPDSEYGALAALYFGKRGAMHLRSGAKARRSEGRASRTAGYLRAASTIFDDATKAAMGGA